MKLKSKIVEKLMGKCSFYNTVNTKYNPHIATETQKLLKQAIMDTEKALIS
jgi:hypothetical protein